MSGEAAKEHKVKVGIMRHQTLNHRLQAVEYSTDLKFCAQML